MNLTISRRSIEYLAHAISGQRLDLLKPLLRSNCYYRSDLINREFYSSEAILSHMDIVQRNTTQSTCRIIALSEVLHPQIHLDSIRFYCNVFPCEYAILFYESNNDKPTAIVTALIESDGKIGSIVFSRNKSIFNVDFAEDESDTVRKNSPNPFIIYGRHSYNPVYFSLADYPLVDRDALCYRYMHDLDWAEIKRLARENGATFFDVSSAIDLFPHLELDENYRLICYVGSEYHGLWGRVAAVKVGCTIEPVIEDEEHFPSLGRHFDLPDSSAPPMEAIYNDGTPEGYLEALLMANFLMAIPYVHWEQEMWDECLLCQPDDYSQGWNIDVEIPDWSPEIKYEIYFGQLIVTIKAFWRHFENGIGSSDGLDNVSLIKHSFRTDLSHLRRSAPEDNSMYRSHIQDDSRYSLMRRCCVSYSSSITVATQKRGFFKT